MRASATCPEGAMVVATRMVPTWRSGSCRRASSTQSCSAGLFSSSLRRTWSAVRPTNAVAADGGSAVPGAGVCTLVPARALLSASGRGSAGFCGAAPRTIQRTIAATARAMSPTNTMKGPWPCRTAFPNMTARGWISVADLGCGVASLGAACSAAAACPEPGALLSSME